VLLSPECGGHVVAVPELVFLADELPFPQRVYFAGPAGDDCGYAGEVLGLVRGAAELGAFRGNVAVLLAAEALEVFE
jgi:hypothetical protein